MKCKSRSTLGVVIGGINVATFFAASIFITVFLFCKNDPNSFINKSNKHNKAIISDIPDALGVFMLVVCISMTLISALMILGIIKRRHRVMIPWLALGAVSFAITFIRSVYSIFSGYYAQFGIGNKFFILLFVGIFVGIQGFVLYKIYTLYKDIRDENCKRPGKILTEGQINFTNGCAAEPNNYTPVPSKA